MRRATIIIGAALSAALALAPAASAASTASVSGSTLTVNGSDPGADTITVWLPGGDGISPGHDGQVNPPTVNDPYYVDDPGGVTAPVGSGCTVDAVVTTRLRCPRGGQPFGSFEVRVNGLGGPDYIQMIRPNQAAPDLVLISGGGDGDALFGSQTGDYISGDGGADLIDGGAGADFLSGGTIGGLVPSPEGAVTQPGSYTPGPGAGVDRVYGGNFDDQITDGDNDTAPGQLDSDKVDGGVCFGGDPLDTALPAGVTGPGAPPITSCPSLANNVDGPEDHDALMLAHRTLPLTVDLLIATASQGGPGENERIRRIEAVWGGSGNDRFYGRDGDLGDESLRGNGGNDHLEARGGDDELLGGDGQDTMLGGAGADIINPGGRVISPAGAPTEMVNDGPDYIDGSTNSTIVGGHSQTDLVTYDGRTDALRLDMTQPTTLGAPGENDTIVGIEDIMGGHRGDTIIGDAANNLIAGDPLPPVFNIPPDPPAYPFPPGGHAGDDHITTRDASYDVVDCTEGSADVHIKDNSDATINCESVNPGIVDTPPPPQLQAKATISGGSSAGSIRVAKDGSFRLPKHVITCPKGDAACKVTNSIADAKASKTKLGSRSYTLKAGAKGAARSKLTKKRLSRLKKRKSWKAAVTIKAVVKGQTTTKKVKVTLKAPKRPKSRKR
jgi:Ca2+-binding RTX toxin-like protein